MRFTIIPRLNGRTTETASITYTTAPLKALSVSVDQLHNSVQNVSAIYNPRSILLSA